MDSGPLYEKVALCLYVYFVPRACLSFSSRSVLPSPLPFFGFRLLDALFARSPIHDLYCILWLGFNYCDCPFMNFIELKKGS